MTAVRMIHGFDGHLTNTSMSIVVVSNIVLECGLVSIVVSIVCKTFFRF
jgi:hypothetical protein